jgi:hypothetical protein
VNEESASETSLDLTLTQHPCDEDPAPQEVRVHLEVDPPRAWYYRISSNFRTLVILLQVDPVSGDEPEILCEDCYEIENTSIFAWFLVPDVGHYHWLRDLIRQLPPNSKVDYPNSRLLVHPKFPPVMNYHYSIDQDSACICSSLLSLFIT